MRYLYGDSSSFPLNQNFIITLAACTDCAVALLRVDEKIHKFRKVSDQANSAAMSELADIDQLIQRLDKAFAQREHLSNATAKVVEQVTATAKAQFDKAKNGVKSWRDGTIRRAQEGCGPGDMMQPLHTFMVKHELPYTSWGLRWKAGRGEEPVQAQVYAIMQRGLTATLSVAIPPKHLWAQPVRLMQLEPKLQIKLMGKNWLGREKLQDVALEKYFVTRITRTSERHQLILSKKAKEISDGLRISLREGEIKRITIQRIDEDENAIGEAASIDNQEAQLIKKVWRKIEETIADLVRHRHQLLAATLYGKRITELESPATVAVAMIQSVAPLVRDMKRHSRTPGELQLKRDLGDGRREELFISAREIVAKYQVLMPKNQQLFDCFGLTTTHVPSEESVKRAEVMSAEELHLSLSQAPSSQPGMLPAIVERQPEQTTPMAHPRAAPSQPSFAPSEPPAIAPVLNTTRTGFAPLSPSFEAPAFRRPPAMEGAPDFAQPPISQGPPPTAPLPDLGVHSSEFAPPMFVSAESLPEFPAPPALPSQPDFAPSLRIPTPAPSQPPPSSHGAGQRPAKMKSSLPPPSVPPRRRARSGNRETQQPRVEAGTTGDAVFRLPPPSVPPPKPVRRRPKGKKPDLRVVNG